MKDSSMHFLHFDGCLLDSEIKTRWSAKGSFLKNFRVPLAQASNQLVWASEVTSAWRNQLAWVSWSSTSWTISFKIHEKTNKQWRTRGRITRTRREKREKVKLELHRSDLGFYPSSFFLLILCTTQWSTSFSEGLDTIFVPLCISFE